MPTGAFSQVEGSQRESVWVGWGRAWVFPASPTPPCPPLHTWLASRRSPAAGRVRLSAVTRRQAHWKRIGRESNLPMIGVCVHSIAATVSVQKTGSHHGEEKEMCFTGHHGRRLVSLWGRFSLDAAKCLREHLMAFQAHRFASLEDRATSVCSRRELLWICQTKVNIKSIAVGK